MPVTSVTTDREALAMTVVAEFPVPVQRVWDAYLDPRQLEKFWGPPSYPATFTRHDAAVGGRSVYTMTGPEGQTSPGFWEWTALDAPRRFEVLEGFAHEDGTPNRQMPIARMAFAFEATASGSRVRITTHFDSTDDLEKVLEMGMEEGMTQAMGQMDAVLADLRSFAADRPILAQVLSDTQVRITRVIRGSVEAVWRAHNECDLVQQWLLGPDGWTMPVCEIATAVGDSYRYEWDNGSDHFGFEGELLAVEAPVRSMTTERMIGKPDQTINEMTLTPVAEGTLLSLVITYPNAEVRDAVLATGMTDGMETSYQRLEFGILATV